MLRIPHIIGLILGLSSAALVLSVMSGRRTPQPPTGAMLSECDGAIREVVIHYMHGAASVASVYRHFLPMLEVGVTVDVVCPDRESFDELSESLPKISCTLRPIVTDHPVTAWSRDRWVALTDVDSTTLLAPLHELAAETWPARAGDEQVAFDLARALTRKVRAHRSDLEFDGGDLLCDGENVFVTTAVVRRNLDHTVGSRQELIHKLEYDLHRRVILMDDSPDHHAGMFMMAATDHTMLVADPRAARDMVPADFDADFSQ